VTDTFLTRIPRFSDAELRRYLEHHLEYRVEAVEAALAELDRRGQILSSEERLRIRSGLARREAAAQAQLASRWGGFLGRTLVSRGSRIRRITAGILALGLGGATWIYLTVPAPAANPLGYEPMDTKRYLRDLELYGGKVNVLATEFMRWWEGLWHGRNLAYTVASMTVLLAFGFWFITMRNTDPPPPAEDDLGPNQAPT
jgi:hypothetical protein